MHTEALPRQYKIDATAQELRLIKAALFHAGSNESQRNEETKALVNALGFQINNTLSQSSGEIHGIR